MTKVYSLLSATALMLATSISAQAETYRVAHGYPPTHPVVAHGIVPWMACVQDKTAGAITFDHFPSGQITSHNAAIDSLNSGVAELTAIITGYVSSQMPLNGLTLLPGMGTTASDMVAAHRAAIDAGGPLTAEFAANKAQPILLNLLPAYQLMGTGKAVETLSDFSGLKTRVSAGSPSLMATALGAIPVEMSTSDMYIAMQRSTVEATFLAVSSAKAYSMPELVKYISRNGAFGSGGAMLSMNEDAFAKLDDTSKQIFTDCGREHEAKLAAHMDAEGGELLKEFEAAGIKIYDFSPEVQVGLNERLGSVATDYVKRLADRGLPAQEAYDQLRAGLKP